MRASLLSVGPIMDQDTHRAASVDCFNRVCELLEKTDRQPDEDVLMREMAHASLFHWLSREDSKLQNLSVGLWQISRVYSVLGDPENARRYAQECIEVSEHGGLDPFFVGYAYEAAGRASSVAGDTARATMFRQDAEALLPKIADEKDRATLAKDLTEL